MESSATYLAPGQRYVNRGLPAWRPEHQITVLRVSAGDDGAVRVAYRCPGGQVVFGFAERLEAAIAAGQIVPVGSVARTLCC